MSPRLHDDDNDNDKDDDNDNDDDDDDDNNDDDDDDDCNEGACVLLPIGSLCNANEVPPFGQ